MSIGYFNSVQEETIYSCVKGTRQLPILFKLPVNESHNKALIESTV